MIEFDIDLILKRWGQTALERPNTEYPRESLKILKMKVNTRYHIPTLTDKELEQIDNAIDVLIKIDYLQYEIIIGYYAFQCSINDLYDYFNQENKCLSKNKIFQNLEQARAFIKGAISMQELKNHQCIFKRGKAYFYA